MADRHLKLYIIFLVSAEVEMKLLCGFPRTFCSSWDGLDGWCSEAGTPDDWLALHSVLLTPLSQVIQILSW